MVAQTPEMFYREMPPITRFIATVTFGVSLLTTLNILNPLLIVLNWVQIWQNFQVWRLLTSVFYVGDFSLFWLVHIYIFVSFSSRLEKHSMFSGPRNFGAYLYFITIISLLVAILSLFISYPKGLPILAPGLNFAILYYWSKKQAFVPVQFWGFSLLAWQLPFALFLADILMGNTIYYDLLGLAAGHTYYFLRDVFDVTKDSYIIVQPPDIFKIISQYMDFFSNPVVTRSQENTSRQSHTFPGRGYRLSD